MRSLISGFKYNLLGFRFFLQNSVLWKFAVIPLILTTIAFGSFAYFGLTFYDDIYYLLSKNLGSPRVANPEGFLDYALSVLFYLLRIMMRIVLFLITSLLVIVSGYIVSLIVNGPFYELMSEKVLELKGARSQEPFTLKKFFRELVAGFKAEITKAGFFVVTTIGLILLSMIPVIGFVFSLIQFFFSAWFFAFGICVYPFVMQRTPLGEIFSWGARNKLKLIGFGLPALFPFVGLFLMNFQVVGGTLLYLDSRDAK